MAVKVAINGFGRIGRPVYRELMKNHPEVEVVAINDLTDNKTLEHLLRYDSIYGKYDGKIECEMLTEKDPEKLPWKKLGVDVVLECTGIFRDKEGASKHLKAGAKKVIISAPSKSDDIPSYILGINADEYKGEDVIDMGSCTTNCLAPVVKVLNDNFEIEKGFMTTVHSYTNDQKILDLPHKDLRRARAAALNLIPTSTGAAKAIGKVIPEVDGKIDGIAIRVPTPVVSLIDLIVQVKKSTTTEKVNDLFDKASNDFKGIMRVEKEPLVSTDFIGETYSSVFDPEKTMVKDNLIKVLAWYDNEIGYSTRLAEMAELIGKKI